MRSHIYVAVVVCACLVAFSALAQSSFGAWYAGASDDKAKHFAVTFNDSGNMLGEYCYPKNGAQCYWMFAVNAGCVKGDKYGVLVNAASGALYLEIYCYEPKNQGGLAEYAFSDFEKMNQLIATN